MKVFFLTLFVLAWNCCLALPGVAVDSGNAYVAGTTETYTVATAPQSTRTFEELSMPSDGDPEENDPIVVPEEGLADSVVEKRNRAHSLLERVTKEQRFLESLDDMSEVELPVGIVKSGGLTDYTILIDRISFTKEGALMEVFVSLALPQSGERIAFSGKIPLSSEGGIAGTARVSLLGDHHLKLNTNTLLTIRGTDKTYVEFDCSGFKGISLEALIQFSRNLIVPETSKGNPKPAPERVKIDFTTYAQSLSDLMIGVTIPAFQVNGLKGVGFQVSKAYMDWSDLANPPGMSFPKGYSSPFLEAKEPLLWQGFYLQSLEVRLPPSFAKQKGDNSRISLGVEKMILDDLGFTGKVFAENILDAGDMNSWGYSIDRVAVELVTNQVKGFDLSGKLTIPVVKDKDGKPARFGYKAQQGAGGDYLFSVKMDNELKLGLWVADMKLFPGSSVVVKERNDVFYPSATFNGELTISALSKGPKVKFNSIRFEKMVISSEAPMFKPGTFGFGEEDGSSSASGFPVSIHNITVKTEPDRVGLGFDVTVNIGGKPEEGGFGGTGALTIWGKKEQGEWGFEKVEIGGIGVNIKKPGVVELEGMVRFFEDDPVYGDGFKGSLSGKLQIIHVDAEALFGKTPDFRYWYADALVELEKGIPMGPALAAYGFGGGFYSKMKQSAGGSALGKTKSGVTYVPDANTMGIRAMVILGTAGTPEAFNGDVALEVMLNTHGGINSVTLKGNAHFMTGMAGDIMGKVKENVPAAVEGKELKQETGGDQGQVYASVLIQYDNVNKVFHANMEMFVNVAGGLVRGVSSGNRAGWATIHFAPDVWYILIGTPDQPLGVEVARIFKSRSYFMIGQNLPGSPPPPPQVSEILGNIDLDYMRDFNALQSGTGIAFGLHFGVSTGDLSFLMFYGNFSAGTGLDFMMKNYGNQYHCQGSSGPMGINGWYANGQAYAFVQGKVGIKVNLKFYKGNYDILSIGAAAVLQAKGPNPFWMRGIVGGYYKILGGLVKGHCRFEVTVGKDCKPIGEQNLLADVNIIAAISPAGNASDVDVFNSPQVAFNIPVNEVFEITDLDNRTHSFRATLEEFTVYDGSTAIAGSLNWNEEHDVVAFESNDALPEKKKLKARARITFEEKASGGWTKVKFDGKIVEEKAESEFTTGEYPDKIPPELVAVSYPQEGQLNFYPGEYRQGFIILKKGLPGLFAPGAQWVQKVRMTGASGTGYVESDLTYSNSEKKISFTIPSGLANAKIYDFEILNIPVQKKAIDANVQKVENKLAVDSSGGDATLTTKKIEGQLDRLEVKTVYSSSFRTSKYNTFREKMERITFAPAVTVKRVDYFQLAAYMNGDELFDGAEIQGINGANRLVGAEAVLEGNGWYKNYVYPLVYEGYPLLGTMRLTVRPEPELLGIPPVRDVYFRQADDGLVLKGRELPDMQSAYAGATIRYNIMGPMLVDYRDLQNQVVNYVVDQPKRVTPRLNSLVTEPFPVIRYGKYKVKLNYTIPGTGIVTSSYELELFNQLNDND